MNECAYRSNCAFVNFYKEHKTNDSVDNLIDYYCRNGHQDDCIRKKLTDTFNRTVVPSAMMPDGMPLPGAKKENWSDEALNYRSLLTL